MGSAITDFGLDEKITKHLNELKIENFYKFQEDAINEIIYGNNVIIEAPTASGKTEAFLLPIVQKIFNEKEVDELF